MEELNKSLILFSGTAQWYLHKGENLLIQKPSADGENCWLLTFFIVCCHLTVIQSILIKTLLCKKHYDKHCGMKDE